MILLFNVALLQGNTQLYVQNDMMLLWSYNNALLIFVKPKIKRYD